MPLRWFKVDPVEYEDSSEDINLTSPYNIHQYDLDWSGNIVFDPSLGRDVFIVLAVGTAAELNAFENGDPGSGEAPRTAVAPPTSQDIANPQPNIVEDLLNEGEKTGKMNGQELPNVSIQVWERRLRGSR